MRIGRCVLGAPFSFKLKQRAFLLVRQFGFVRLVPPLFTVTGNAFGLPGFFDAR